eukprot:CAMPEP_0167814320 /NCGR_PEP_ID=MMETSP0112_2-20121227/2359_1 /TAXON_ID=91324 /ORGANISM="Lotharella globosa, Strain CCCM811" /LENGTH=83 /DNA_ID=CAMNT_0007713531 /DNA_START=481 /DNA_END=732 /DNA_ORIENTATION=+
MTAVSPTTITPPIDNPTQSHVGPLLFPLDPSPLSSLVSPPPPFFPSSPELPPPDPPGPSWISDMGMLFDNEHLIRLKVALSAW